MDTYSEWVRTKKVAYERIRGERTRTKGRSYQEGHATVGLSRYPAIRTLESVVSTSLSFLPPSPYLFSMYPFCLFKTSISVLKSAFCWGAAGLRGQEGGGGRGGREGASRKGSGRGRKRLRRGKREEEGGEEGRGGGGWRVPPRTRRPQWPRPALLRVLWRRLFPVRRGRTLAPRDHLFSCETPDVFGLQLGLPVPLGGAEGASDANEAARPFSRQRASADESRKPGFGSLGRPSEGSSPPSAVGLAAPSCGERRPARRCHVPG